MQSRSLQSIFLLLIGFLFITSQDVMIKFVSGDYALLQLMLVRTLFSIPIVFIILHYNGGIRSLKTTTPLLQFWRGLAMFLAYFFFLLAIATLPYSTLMSIFLSGPLFITALSVPILGETVGWQRWLAVLVGFFGMLIVIDPRGATFDSATIFAVLSAVMYALSIIATRKIGSSGAVITTYTAFVYLFATLALIPFIRTLTGTVTHPSVAFLFREWPSMPLSDVLFVAAVALFWGIGMTMLAMAYQKSAVSLLAPFEYFSIVYGFLFGYLVWREIPTPQMLLGIALIIASGLFIIYRENRINSIE